MDAPRRVGTARVGEARGDAALTVVEGLTLGYRRDLPVLSNLSVELQGPGVFRLDGVNGAGKSTLFEALAGYLEPLAGRIEVGGEAVVPGQRVPRLRLQRSEPTFVPGVTMRDHLHLYSRRYGVKLADALALAGELQLSPHLNKAPESLSTGTLKKAWFVCSWVGHEPVWCLDEPFNGVDTDSCELMSRLVMARGEIGLVLLVSHLTPPGLRWGSAVELAGTGLLIQQVHGV